MKLRRQYQWHRYRHRCQLPFLFGFSCQLGLRYCQGGFCWFLLARWLVWLYCGHGLQWILGVGNVGKLRVCLVLPMAAQKRPHNALPIETELSVIDDLKSGCFTKTAIFTSLSYFLTFLITFCADSSGLWLCGSRIFVGRSFLIRFATPIICC